MVKLLVEKVYSNKKWRKYEKIKREEEMAKKNLEALNALTN